MPFIQNNIDPAAMRPQSHTGRISMQSVQAKTASQSSARPQSTDPVFMPSPVEKLYSSPPPMYDNFETLRKSKESLELDIRYHRSGGLLLPLELSKETAYMGNKKQDYQQSTEGGQLLALLRERRLYRPVIGRVNYVENDLQVQGKTMAMPSRPHSQMAGRGDSLSYASENFKYTYESTDLAKRLKEASDLSLQNIRQARPVSSYGRQLDKKILAKNVKIPPRPESKAQQGNKPLKYALNDWIVKSRAGKATNRPLRSQSEIEMLEDNNRVEIKQSNSAAVDGGAHIQRFQARTQKQTHKELVESIITTIDDVLPIFQCIRERIDLEGILKNDYLSGPEKNERLKTIFKTRNVHFNYAQYYEASLHGEAYYENLKARYSQLLKSSPDLVANTLLQSEFVYLTYDTPEVRKFITAQYLRKCKNDNTYLQYIEAPNENPYAKPNPHYNCYELLVCAFDQVNPNQYFTISSAGITEFYDKNAQTAVTSMDEWMHERAIFCQIKKIRFFTEFLQRKAMFLWKMQVKAVRKTRAFAAINRLSLQANVTFYKSMSEVCCIIKRIAYDLRVVDYKLYSFEHSTYYLNKVARGNQRYMAYFYYHSERRVITLVDFVKAWNGNLSSINEFLRQSVEYISEILLTVCRTVAQNIQARTLAASEVKGKNFQQNSANQILSAISNATTFNMTRIKSLIKAADYNLAETFLAKLVDINEYIIELFFGVKCPDDVLPVNTSERDGILSEESGDSNSENREIIDRFNRHTMPEREYYKSLERQPPTEYELLLQFLGAFDSLELVASQDVDVDTSLTQAVRFDRYVKREGFAVPNYLVYPGISKIIRPYNLLAYFYYTMRDDVVQRIIEYYHYLTGVPLVACYSRYPPLPLFHVYIVFSEGRFDAIPNQKDLVELLGDCLSEIATMFHRSIRPYSYPKLASFLSETTRTSNLNEFLGLNIKDSLAQSEDYIMSIRTIKQMLSYAFSFIDQYCQGFSGIFYRFVRCITEFQYQYAEASSRFVFFYNSHLRFGSLLETVQVVIEHFRSQSPVFSDILKQIAFPGLMSVDQLRSAQKEGEDVYYDEYVAEALPIQLQFDIPDWNMQFYDVFRQPGETDYALAATLLYPHHFIVRNTELERYLVDLYILKVRRAIMCFNVSTVELYEEFTPCVVHFYFFVRMTLPLCIISMQQLLTRRAISHSTVLEKIPKVPDNSSADFKIPYYTEFAQCLFDFSGLVLYNEGEQYVDVQTLKQQFVEERNLARTVNEAKREKAEAQRYLFLNAKQDFQQRLKGKGKKAKAESADSKQSDTVEQSEVAQSNQTELAHDEESELPDPAKLFDAQVDRLLEYTPHVYYVSSVGQLSPTAYQLYKYLNDTRVDKHLLDTVKLIIEVYEVAKSEVHIFREGERKIINLFEVGSQLGILDELGNLKTDELSLSILQENFGLDLEMSIKEQFKEFYNYFYFLERNITNFTIRKPQLYQHFRFNLVVLYVQLGSQFGDILQDMLHLKFNMNVYVQELENSCHRAVVYQGETYYLNRGRSIQDEQYLFLYLLFYNTDYSLKNDGVKFSRLRFYHFSEQLEELNSEYGYFSRCLYLFDSLDFNISTSVLKTEVSFVSEFCGYLCGIFASFWSTVSHLQSVIQQTCCLPLVLLNLQEYKDELNGISTELDAIDNGILALLSGFEAVIRRLYYDYNGALLNSSIPDDYDSIFNYSTLKFLIFAYKSHLKKTQLLYTQDKLKAFADALDAVLQHEKEGDSSSEFQLGFSYESEPEIFKSVRVDDIKFYVLARDALAYFFIRTDELQLVKYLVASLYKPCKSLAIMQTIAFQPRHFYNVCRYHVPTPDLAYETHITRKILVKIPERYQVMSMGDLLAKDKENAYRKIFGMTGDGVVELLLYYIALLPRKEAIQKQLFTLKLAESSAFTWELRDTYLDVILKLPQFRGGRTLTYYEEHILQEHQTADLLKNKQLEPNQVKVYETDVEDAADEETITTKSYVFQTTMSTLQFHNDAVFQRNVEIILRRRKQKHIGHRVVHSPLGKGGFFQEMDRFTCTISKLVLRGLFYQLDKIDAVAQNADAEYKLLDKLSGTRDLIMSLRLKMLTFTAEPLRINYISDPSKVIQTLNDQLISLRSLNSQFRNLINTDISIAIQKLDQLEYQSEYTITTIKLLIMTYTTAMELMPIFSVAQGAVCKALPEETRQFSRIFRYLANLLQQMFETNGLAVKNCTDEVAKLISTKVQPEFENLQRQVERYLQQKRDNYSRFYFLNNKLLCQFLNIYFTEQTVGPANTTLNLSIDQMFYNIKQTDGAIYQDQDGYKRFIIRQIGSAEGETLSIVPFSVRGQAETWISAFYQKVYNAVSDQIARCFAEFLYFSRESMGVYGFDSKKVAAKEQKTQNEQFDVKASNIVAGYCAYALIVCFQAIILFYFDNCEAFYSLEKFNLARQISKRAAELRENEEQPRVVKSATEKDVAANLATFYQKLCQTLLKQLRLSKTKIEYAKLHLLILTAVEASEAVDVLKHSFDDTDPYYNFLTYFYDTAYHQLYCTDFAYHSQWYGNQRSTFAAKLNYGYPYGQIYGMEYQGLQQRLLLSERLVQQNIFIYHHHMATHEPLLMSGETGCGKSLQVYNYAAYCGYYLAQVYCSGNTKFAEFQLKLMGSCLNGSFILFEDIDKLDLGVFSMLCIYLYYIQQALQSFQLQFYIAGQAFKLLPTTAIFGTLGGNVSRRMSSHFKVVQTVIPDTALLIKKFLYMCGFVSYQILAKRLAYFYQMLNQQYIRSDMQFYSFRVVKQYLLILQGTFERWTAKFSQSSRLSQYFSNSKSAGYKHYKEQQDFFAFIEQYCVVYCIFKFFVPYFYTKLQDQLLRYLISTVFSREIVDMIDKDERATKSLYTSSIKSNILKTTRAAFLRSKSHKSGGFGLQESRASDKQLLFFQLTLMKSVYTDDLSTLFCQNVFFGEAEIYASGADDTQLHDSSLHAGDSSLLQTRYSQTDLLYVSGRSGTLETRLRENSESDSASGSGFYALSQRDVAWDGETFNAQVQGVVNGYVVKNYLHQINQFIKGLVQNDKLVVQAQLNYYYEFEGALWYRTAVIIKGPRNSGKSTLWKTILDRSNDYLEVYPASLSEEELFGFTENGYFSDGVVTSFIRRVLNQQKEMNNPDNVSTLNLKFLVFNGYADNLLRLISAIDDARYLILYNGEFLRIPNNIRIVIEVQSMTGIPVQFYQRCITVAIESTYYVPFLSTWLKQLLCNDYAEFLAYFDFDVESQKLVKKQTVPYVYPRYRKKSAEEVLREKLSALQTYDNLFLETTDFVAFMLTQVQSLVEVNGFDVLQFIKRVYVQLSVYSALISYDLPQIMRVFIIRQAIFFAFYHSSEYIALTAQDLFSQLYSLVFRPVLEILVLPERMVHASEIMFDPTGLVPQRIQDGALDKFSGQAADLFKRTLFNSAPEGDIASMYYDAVRDKLVVQTVAQRRVFAYLALAYEHLGSGTMYLLCGCDADYYNVLLFDAFANGIQKARFGISERTTLAEFKAFFLALFNDAGVQMLPLYEVPVVVHLFGLDNACAGIVAFIRQLLTSATYFAHGGFQFTLRQFVNFRFVASAHSFISFYSLDNILIHRIPEYDTRSQREIITHMVSAWSMEKFRASDAQIFPIFHHLQRFLIAVHSRMESNPAYSFSLMLDFLRLLNKLDYITFAEDMLLFYDVSFAPRFKRMLFYSVIFLLRKAVFVHVYNAQTESSVITESVEESLIFYQVVELKTQAGMKVPIKYHPEQFYNPGNFMVHFAMPLFTDMTGSYAFYQFYPLSTTKFIETEFPSRYNQLYAISERLPMDLPKCPDVSTAKPLLSYVDTQMVELRRRALNFNQELCNYRNFIVVDRPGYYTRFLIMKLAMRYNFRFCCAGDHLEEGQNLFNSLVISLQKALSQVIYSIIYEYPYFCLFYVPNQYLRNTSVVSFIWQLCQSGSEYSLFQVESGPLHLLIQALRACFDTSGRLTDIYLKQKAFDVLFVCFKFVLAPEIDTLQQLSPLEYLCRLEKEQLWALESVFQVALQNLPEQCAEMRKLCANERIRDMFLHTFQQLLQMLSITEQYYDVLLSADFCARFLICYHSIYFTKRSILMKQKTIYGKGIGLFTVSAQSLQKIEADLHIIKPKLLLLYTNTDLLVTYLNTQKSDIQAKTQIVKIEEKALQLKSQQIEQELAQAQIELDEVMPMLDRAAQALKQITRQEIAEIGSFANPKQQIIMVMSAVCVILGESPSWQTARQLMSSGNLITQLLYLRPREVAAKQMKQFKQILANEQFYVDKIQQISLAASILADWCISVVAYCDAYEHIQPRIDRLKNARAEYEESTAYLECRKQEIADLTANMQLVESQLDKAMREKEEYEREMKALEKRQGIVKQLNELLNIQYTQWKTELDNSNNEIEQLSVLSLLATTYTLIQYSQEQRQHEESITQFILRSLGFQNTTGITPDAVYAFMANEQAQSVWKIHNLFGDRVIFTGMCALSSLVSTPYIVDPDLVFLNAVQALQLPVFTFKDASWMELFVKSVSQPKTLVLQVDDVSSIPNLVRDVMRHCNFDLSRLFNDQAGYTRTVECVINDLQVDINEHLQFILINNLTKAINSLSPEILAQYQVVSFIKDEQSLIYQISSVIIDAQNSEMEKQRIEAIKNQATQQLQLNNVEMYIVQRLLVFDFAKDLDAAQSTIIPELQNAVGIKSQLYEKIKEIEAQTAILQEFREKYFASAKYMSFLYLAISDHCPEYRLAQFNAYIKQFISFGMQTVFDNILLSVDYKFQKAILFQIICYIHQEKAFDPVLLKACQQAILRPSPLIVFNPDAYVFSSRSYEFSEFMASEEQLASFTRGRNEKSFDHMQRCCSVCYLLQGVFKSQGKYQAAEAQVPRDSPFYTHFLSRVQPPKEHLADLRPELQYYISFAIQTKWKSHFLEIFSPDNNNLVYLREYQNILVPYFFATIYHLCESIVYRVKEFNGQDVQPLIVYLSILFTKMLKPDYFDVITTKIIELSGDILPYCYRMASPESVLQHYIASFTANPLFIAGSQITSMSLINAKLQHYRPADDDSKVKPQHPKILVTSLQLAEPGHLFYAITNQLMPQWVILVNFDLSTESDLEKLHDFYQLCAYRSKQIHSDSRVFLMGYEDIDVYQMRMLYQTRLAYLPKLFVQSTISADDCSDQLTETTSEIGDPLDSKTSKIATRISNYFRAFFVAGQYDNILVTIVHNDLSYFRKFFKNLVFQQSLLKNYSNRLVSARFAYLFGSSLSRTYLTHIDALVNFASHSAKPAIPEEASSIGLPAERLMDYYRHTSQSNLKYTYHWVRSMKTAVYEEFVDMPLNQFFILEYLQLQQQINLSQVKNVPLFFSSLHLQAAAIFGYSPSDYKLVFSTYPPAYNDVVITGMRFRNTEKQVASLKVMAMLHYKRRDLYLPLLCVPKLEKEKTKSLKIALPASRFSEFSLGSIGDTQDHDVEIKAPERPLKERRLGQYLMSQCKICANAVEIRRAGQSLGSLHVDFGEQEELALNGVYCEV